MKLPKETFARLQPAFDGRRACVTGGAGFIGGHLVDALVSLGAHVTVIDDLSNSTLDHLASLIELEPSRIRFVHGSVLDDDALRDAVIGSGSRGAADIVFHLAAVGSVPRSVAEPQRTWSVNATGTLRVLEAARAAKARRVVFASSSSVYGDGQIPSTGRAETSPPAPLSPYAASKVSAEHLCAAWSHCYAISTIALRYFNVFGPRQPAENAYAAVIPAMTRRLLDGQPPSVYGDGRQVRDFTFVANAVLGTLLAGAGERSFRGDVVNIGSGRRVSIIELAHALAERCGVPDITPAFQPPRVGDVRDSMADLSRARSLLGYEPVIAFEDGLAATVEWAKGVTADP